MLLDTAELSDDGSSFLCFEIMLEIERPVKEAGNWKLYLADMSYRQF